VGRRPHPTAGARAGKLALAGPVAGFDPFPSQAQQFIPAFDLDVSPKWEINFGLGVGVTRATDHMLFKAIIGRRFDWSKRKKKTEDPQL
jgi:hypothetical protein